MGTSRIAALLLWAVRQEPSLAPMPADRRLQRETAVPSVRKACPDCRMALHIRRTLLSGYHVQPTDIVGMYWGRSVFQHRGDASDAASCGASTDERERQSITAGAAYLAPLGGGTGTWTEKKMKGAAIATILLVLMAPLGLAQPEAASTFVELKSDDARAKALAMSAVALRQNGSNVTVTAAIRRWPNVLDVQREQWYTNGTHILGFLVAYHGVGRGVAVDDTVSWSIGGVRTQNIVKLTVLQFPDLSVHVDHLRKATQRPARLNQGRPRRGPFPLTRYRLPPSLRAQGNMT